MLRFYFHLHNDTDVPDLEGREFPDLPGAHAAALREARVLIGELVKSEAKLVLSHRIDVEDTRGVVLDERPFPRLGSNRSLAQTTAE